MTETGTKAQTPLTRTVDGAELPVPGTYAVSALDNLGLISRTRAAGERMDRVRIDMGGPRSMGFDVTEYREQGDLAREGLAMLVQRTPKAAGGAAGVGCVRRLLGGATAAAGEGLESPS